MGLLIGFFMLQGERLDERHEQIDALRNLGKAIEHLLLFGWGHINTPWLIGGNEKGPETA